MNGRFRLLVVALVGMCVLTACNSGASTDDAASSAVPETEQPQVAATAIASVDYDFATGPAVLVEEGFEAPKDRVASTGAYLPANGKPTLVMVDAIWCPSCAITRPIFYRLRPDYQDDINIVVLDFDIEEDAELARRLGAWAHPAWAVVAPDSDEVLERRFGPLNEPNLRELLDGVRAAHSGA